MTDARDLERQPNHSGERMMDNDGTRKILDTYLRIVFTILFYWIGLSGKAPSKSVGRCSRMAILRGQSGLKWA